MPLTLSSSGCLKEGPMQLRKWLPVSLMLAVGAERYHRRWRRRIYRAELRKLPATGGGFTEFETLQVRPLALSTDGNTLFAMNTPDNRLEIYQSQRRRAEAVARSTSASSRSPSPCATTTRSGSSITCRTRSAS